MRIRFLYVFLIGVLLIALVPILHAKVEVKASINADKIGRDDILLFTFAIYGVQNPPRPHIQFSGDFNVRNTSISFQSTTINGVHTVATSYLYYLSPKRTGSLKIPPVSYQYRGEVFNTSGLEVEVVEGSVAKTPPRRRRSWSLFDDEDLSSPFDGFRKRDQVVDIRLRSEVSKKTVRLGEQIIYRVFLITLNNVVEASPLKGETFPGFWQEWFPVPRSVTPETKNIDGKLYRVYEIRKAALFPNKTGEVTIPSIQFQIGYQDTSDSFFSMTKKVLRDTPIHRIQVLPLPSQVDTGSVGDFQFMLTADRKEMDINDILTIKMVISGKGNIKTVEIPELTGTDYYKVYPSKISRKTNFQQDYLAGVVEAEIPVSFKKSGLIQFPAVTFSFFHPESGTVKSLKSTPLMVKVTGKKEAVTPAGSIKNSEIVKKGEDIDFIQQGRIAEKRHLLFRTGFYRFLILFPFLVSLVVLAKKYLIDRWISGSSIVAKRRLIGLYTRRINKADDYGQIAPIIDDYICERTGMGHSEVNQFTIGEILGKNNISDSDIRQLLNLRSQSESIRFSPDKKSGKELRQALRLLIHLLKKIDGKIK